MLIQETFVPGNDTIDRYPPACSEIEKTLCTSEKTFERIQKAFEGFLKSNTIPKPKIVKTKDKPIKKTIIPTNPSSFKPTNSIGNLTNSYRHRVGRLNDWDSIYGQGMYK